jgi:hypothetical protein
MTIKDATEMDPLDREWDEALVKILREKGFHVYAAIVDAEIQQFHLEDKKLD